MQPFPGCTDSIKLFFFILRPLRSIHLSLDRSVFQSIVVALVLSKLDFGNTTLAGLPLYQLHLLQSVMNATASLVFSASRYDQIMPLLHRLHWLRAPQQISFKLTVLPFRCLNGLTPTYLTDSVQHVKQKQSKKQSKVVKKTGEGRGLYVADLPGRQRLRSASSADLAVPQTRLRTVGATERFVLWWQKPGTVFRQKWRHRWHCRHQTET